MNENTLTLLSLFLILGKTLIIGLYLLPYINENLCNECEIVQIQCVAVIGLILSILNNVFYILKLFCGYLCIIVIYLGFLYFPIIWLTVLTFKGDIKSKELTPTIWIISMCLVDTVFQLFSISNQFYKRISCKDRKKILK